MDKRLKKGRKKIRKILSYYVFEATDGETESLIEGFKNCSPESQSQMEFFIGEVLYWRKKFEKKRHKMQKIQALRNSI